MCKDGKPCDDAGKMTNTRALFNRMETLIVLAELHEDHEVDVPHAAVALIDVLGPLLMDGIKTAKGWNALQLAQEIIKQKGKLYAAQGMNAPMTGMETLIEMLGELAGGAPTR